MEEDRCNGARFHTQMDSSASLFCPLFTRAERIRAAKEIFERLCENLKKKGNLLGLVLDMRENSGGFLNQAVKVAGLFITSGVIVISKYSQGEVQYLRDIDGESLYSGLSACSYLESIGIGS